ncbi:type I methionyl aminopeptidase [Candidatus Parcubacteria bacterium]|jgi:methionyl aminopeptidase|nr:type I methionyl aminopeptidase [Candidatus Parcubacteria bacterium]
MISIKTKQEIAIMAEAGKILAKIVKQLEQMVDVGITTKQLDKAAEDLIFKYNTEPAFKGYGGYPAALCSSVNQSIVHEVPCDYKLKQGDIITLDLGLKYKGYLSDMAITVPVGEVVPEILRLIRATKKALKRGIKKSRPGNTFGDIGNTIQRHAEDQGFGVVRELCGHGIGKELHEEPEVLNYGKRRAGAVIKPGMVFCIEPMLTTGDWKIRRGPDGHAFQTIDGSVCAHFEHTIAITAHGPKVLTEIKD